MSPCKQILAITSSHSLSPWRRKQYVPSKISYPSICDYKKPHTIQDNMFSSCFILLSCLACSPTLKIQAKRSSETSVDFERTTRRYTQKIELFITTVVRTSKPVQILSPTGMDVSTSRYTVFKYLTTLYHLMRLKDVRYSTSQPSTTSNICNS
jgi:hypothetical protein